MTPLPKDESKRERIILAAMEVFSQDGLAKGTIADVAKKADIGKGTVYEYFSSKDAIFKALLEYFFGQMIAEWSDLARMDIPIADKFNLLIDGTFDIVDELDNSHNQNWGLIFEILLYALRQPAGHDENINLAEIFRKIIHTLEPLLQEGIDTGLIAPMNTEILSFLFFAILDGVGLHVFIQNGHYPANEMKTILKDILIKGLLRREH